MGFMGPPFHLARGFDLFLDGILAAVEKVVDGEFSLADVDGDDARPGKFLLLGQPPGDGSCQFGRSAFVDDSPKLATHLVSPAVAAATAIAGHFATPADLGIDAAAGESA